MVQGDIQLCTRCYEAPTAVKVTSLRDCSQTRAKGGVSALRAISAATPKRQARDWPEIYESVTLPGDWPGGGDGPKTSRGRVTVIEKG